MSKVTTKIPRLLAFQWGRAYIALCASTCPGMVFGNDQSRWIPHLEDGYSRERLTSVPYQLPRPEGLTQAGKSSCSPADAELVLWLSRLVTYLLPRSSLSFYFCLPGEAQNWCSPPCLHLQIKTEDLSDSLQQTLSHRPCHPSQGPATIPGNQMSGVNGSPSREALIFSEGQWV